MLFTLTPSAPVDGYGEALLPLADCKLHLKIEDDVDDEDPLIEALRDAAIEAVELYTKVRMAPCEGLVATFAGFGPRMDAGVGPAWSVVVTGVDYLDSDGVASAIAVGGWRLGVGGDLLPAAGTLWPFGATRIAMTFNAGYPDGACPRALIMAAKLMLAFLYANRGELTTEGLKGDYPAGVIWWCDRIRIPTI